MAEYFWLTRLLPGASALALLLFGRRLSRTWVAWQASAAVFASVILSKAPLLHLARASDGAPQAELLLGTIHVSGRPRSFELPALEHELSWRLGNDVRLLGYDVERSVKPGETLRITLYWQCLSEMVESYTVFTHLLDPENVTRGQLDRVPGVPEAPTTSWVQGEVIADPYEIPVDPHAPPGEYTLEIGMYDAATMKRLTVYDAQEVYQGDRVLLGTLRVHSEDVGADPEAESG